MPELPEVETIARELERALSGKRILDVFVYREKNLVGGADAFREAVKGKNILAVQRRGKFLVFALSDELFLLSHLRMEGRYRIQKGTPTRNKHDIVSLALSGNETLTYEDTRKFGRIEPLSKRELETRLATLGPEPIGLSGEDFFAILQTSNAPLKEALMDQHLFAGIGNIYACEILFASRLSPFLPAKDVTKEEAFRLAKESTRILNLAIAERGSTVHSFLNFSGMEGNMQNLLQVYGKRETPCPVCGTKLTYTKCGGRGTTYCPHCQHSSILPYILGITGPIHAGKSTASRFFENRGWRVFDADKEVKALYRNRDILRDMKAMLGKQSVVRGKINPSYLRSVFADSPALRSTWEKHLEPFLERRFEEVKSSLKPGENLVLDVPLLARSSLRFHCDSVLLLLAPESERKARLELEGKDADGLLKLNASYPFEASKRLATYEIENEGDLSALEKKLKALPLP